MAGPKTRKTRSQQSAAPPDGPFEPATAGQIDDLLAQLHALYPDADCELDFDTPLDLLIATILSAQSTDVRVNLVTPDLFTRYRSAQDYADADLPTLEQEVHSTGFYRQKAKNLKATGQMLVERHGGEVPQELDALVELPGVARKTANVVLGTAFRIPSGVAVDTHVKRLAYRLGLTQETQPVKVERDLMQRLPQEEWIFGAHAIILHGRRVCKARKPACSECTMLAWCPRNGLQPLEEEANQ